MRELLGEGVPEVRGGGSGVWRRTEECPLGEVKALHWALSDGNYTELSLRGRGSAWTFPSIYLLGHVGHVERETANLFDLYVTHLFKLGSPKLFISILKAISDQARKDGEEAAQARIRKAIGLSEHLFGMGE